MPTVEVDFETFKALTALRPSEEVSAGDVIKQLVGLTPQTGTPSGQDVWVSEKVAFPIGTKLRHRFRDGTVAEGRIVSNGVEVKGKTFNGLSPAAAYGAGHTSNGWHFWEVRQPSGEWVKANDLRVRT